jgi:DNA ligase 1
MRYKPMLAYKAGKKPITLNEWEEGIHMQPKLDGVRCMIQYSTWSESPDEPKVMAYSRTGKEWKNIDHILLELEPFFKRFPHVVLDGELYNHDLRRDFEKIISLVRKTKPTEADRQESKEKVQFHCYDFVSATWPGVISHNFDRRNEFLRMEFTNDYHSVKILDFEIVHNERIAAFYHTRNLECGYEGSILRKNALYECKRSYNLQKYKDFHDAEAVIVGYTPGKGKRTGTLGKFLMRDHRGVEFGCPPGKGYDYEDMANMLKNIDDYIGQTATFTYFERTKANSYRHPHFKCIRDYE